MAITGGFGMTLDLKTGAMRRWAMGRDGIKHWMGSGDSVEKGLLDRPRFMPCELVLIDGDSSCKTCGQVRHSACEAGGKKTTA